MEKPTKTNNGLLQRVRNLTFFASLLGLLMLSACGGENTRDAGNIDDSTDPAGSTSGTGDDLNSGTSEDPTEGLTEDPADFDAETNSADTTGMTGGTTGSTGTSSGTTGTTAGTTAGGSTGGAGTTE